MDFPNFVIPEPETVTADEIAQQLAQFIENYSEFVENPLTLLEYIKILNNTYDFKEHAKDYRQFLDDAYPDNKILPENHRSLIGFLVFHMNGYYKYVRQLIMAKCYINLQGNKLIIMMPKDIYNGKSQHDRHIQLIATVLHTIHKIIVDAFRMYANMLMVAPDNKSMNTLLVVYGYHLAHYIMVLPKYAEMMHKEVPKSQQTKYICMTDRANANVIASQAVCKNAYNNKVCLCGMNHPEMKSSK